METEMINPKKKHRTRKIILWTVAVFFTLLIAGFFILKANLNGILTNALNKSFDSNIASDVYELKFEKLSVNVLMGNVKVFNVELHPRERPLKNYPYINSSFRLKTGSMILKNVELLTLIRSNKLKLEKIELTGPGIDFTIADSVPVFFPFKDTVTSTGPVDKTKKKPIESYFLKEFNMVDASFRVTNSAKERNFNIQKINLSLQDIMIDQFAGKDLTSFKHFEFSIGEFSGSLQKKAVKQIKCKDFHIKIDSLSIEKTLDTSIWRYADFGMGLKALDVQTADSLFHLTLGSFDLSYKEKSIKLKDVSFKPNVSEATIQRRYTYQHSQFSATIGILTMNNVNFDSLIFKRKIFIHEVILDKVNAAIYKDNTKPVDKGRFPAYLGQSIRNISLPLHIKQIKVTNANLVNTERKPDGNLAKANINRGTVTVSNMTNQSTEKPLELHADAYIENQAHTKLTLAFSYTEPQFTMNGRIEKFVLADLNHLIYAYTPVKILKGTADEITFSATVFHTKSTGDLQFLYHDLEIDMALRNQAKWKSDVLAFAANNIVNSANPATGLPVRDVSFNAERNMNKGFVNIMIKSLLAGMKETMIMSKENRKEYKQEKKELKKEARQEKKEAKKKAKNN